MAERKTQLTLSRAIALLESLVARHDATRHRYAMEVLAHVDVQNDHVSAWSTDRDHAIYWQARADARARVTTEGP